MTTTNPYVFGFFILIGVIVSSIVVIFFLRFLDEKYVEKLKPSDRASVKKPSLLSGFAISWCFAISLGCVLAVGIVWAGDNFSGWNLITLLQYVAMIMFIPPMGLIVSTFAAVLATPFAARALRTGTRNLILYGSYFWVFLACYMLLAPSFHNNNLFIFVGVLVTLFGLVFIGQIPPKPIIGTIDRREKNLVLLMAVLTIGATLVGVNLNNRIPEDENTLIERMGNNDMDVSFNAAHKLEQKGKGPFLRACLNSNPNVRACAAHFLMDFPGKDVQRTLITTANDTDPWVRMWSAYSLGEIGDKDAIETLKKLSLDEKDFVKLDAVEALEKLHSRIGN